MRSCTQARTLPQSARLLFAAGMSFRDRSAARSHACTFPIRCGLHLRERLSDTLQSIRMGDVADFRKLHGRRYRCNGHSRRSPATSKVRGNRPTRRSFAGGETDDSVGYFIRPVLIRAKKPDYRTMTEEIFGPVVTVYVYPEREWRSRLSLSTARLPMRLTGAVFANDRKAIDQARSVLRFAAGNFYINDKPTGAVVGQQPFGGSQSQRHE